MPGPSRVTSWVTRMGARDHRRAASAPRAREHEERSDDDERDRLDDRVGGRGRLLVPSTRVQGEVAGEQCERDRLGDQDRRDDPQPQQTGRDGLRRRSARHVRRFVGDRSRGDSRRWRLRAR